MSHKLGKQLKSIMNQNRTRYLNEKFGVQTTLIYCVVKG